LLTIITAIDEIKEAMKSPFGKNLKVLMAKNDVTAQHLAKSLKISSRTVNEWIGSGARTPRNLEQIKALAEYFNCSVHMLLFGEEDRNVFNELLTKTDIHVGLYEISIKRVLKK
jgi:transcriptional regulator with XRE-family HTH domain